MIMHPQAVRVAARTVGIPAQQSLPAHDYLQGHEQDAGLAEPGKSNATKGVLSVDNAQG